MAILDLPKPISFDWDDGNRNKNLIKHNVRPSEAEQVIINVPLLFPDDIHSTNSEQRILALGKTDAERLLTLIITIRNNKIRVISVRDMSKKERMLYEKTKKNKTNS